MNKRTDCIMKLLNNIIRPSAVRGIFGKWSGHRRHYFTTDSVSSALYVHYVMYTLCHTSVDLRICVNLRENGKICGHL